MESFVLGASFRIKEKIFKSSLVVALRLPRNSKIDYILIMWERGDTIYSLFKFTIQFLFIIYRASSVIPNGSRSLSNGNSHNGISSHSSVGGLTNVPKESSAVDANKSGGAPPNYAAVAAFCPTGPAEVIKQVKSTSDSDQLSPSAAPVTVSSACSSGLDPVLMPALFHNPSAVYATEHLGSQMLAAEPNHLQGKKDVPQDVSDLELSKNEKTASEDVSSIHEKESPEKSTAVQTNIVSQSFLPSSVSDNSLVISSSDSASCSTQESDVPKGGIN